VFCSIGVGEEDGIPDVEEVEEPEEVIHETMFTFEAFEMVTSCPQFLSCSESPTQPEIRSR
jgi:hypothetical protein